jgi:autotransporter-associated beta strand protein
MNKKTILKFNSTKSVRPASWLAMAIFAVGAFGNSVQAQWVNENFNTLGAGVAPTATLPLVKNGDGFALGVLPSGGALQINTTGTTLASETRWSLSDATFSTPRTSGYFAFKIKQNANVNAVAANFINFRLGAANANSLTTSANNWLEVRFIQSASSNIKVATQSANLMTATISSTTQVPIQIWYNQSGSAINYTRPDTGVSTSLASGTFAVFANNVAILAPGTFPAGVTSANTDTTPIGKFAFTVASSTKIDFTIDDLYAAASAPATTSAPTLTTNPIPVTAQAGTTVNNAISYGGNPTPVFSTTTTGGTWPIWATLSSSGTATFTPSSSVTPAEYTLTFRGENSQGSINGTFNVTVTAAATTPPTITSSSSPVVAKYLSSYTTAIPLYTLTSTGDAPITYTAANLPVGLSLSGSTIIGSATTLGQSVNVTLTALNAAGSSTPITLPIKVANYSWNGTGTDWTQASSWNYDGAVATLAPVFNYAGDVAVLGSGGSTVVVPDIGSSIAGLIFNLGSPAYQFSGGTLTVGNNASIVNQSTSAITFANKVVNNGGNATWSSVAGGSIVLGGGFDCTGSDSASNRTVTLGGYGDFTVGGPIGNGGNVGTVVGTVVVTSTGTTLFNAANTYSGTTTVGAGANLKLGNVAALGNATGATTVSGTLDLFGFSPAAEKFTLSGGSIVNSSSTPVTIDGTVTLTGALNTINTSTGAMTMSGVISSSGAFTKTGANTLTLTGVNTFTGGFTLNGGTVIGNSESPFGNFNSSYSVNVAGGNLIVQNPAALGYGANGSANVSARPKVILGGGTLTAQADLTLNANSGTSGQVTISAPSTISVDNNKTVKIEKMVPTDTTIAANSVLTKTGLGTLNIIGSASTVIGGYMVNEGTLAFTGSANAGMGSGPIVMNGGSLSVSKGAGSLGQYSGFNISNLLSLQRDTVNYFEPNVNSPAGYNVMSLGALNLNGYKLTYRRTSTAPFVSVPQTDPMVTFRSATLNTGANGLENDTSLVLVLQGASGTGGLTKTGTGTLVLSDQPNQGSANAILTSGVVTSVGLGDNPLKGFTATPIVTIAPPINSDGTPVAGGVQATATATIDSNGVITAITVGVGGGGSGYLSSPQVTVTPNNAVTVNTYNGQTSVQGGKLNLSGSSSSSISLASGTTLELNYQAPSEATASLDNNVSTMPLKGITLVKSFAGYTGTPTVTIGAPQNLDGTLIANGVAATATAQVAGGRIVGLTITSPGSGYLLTQRPNVTIAPPDQETVVATTTGSLSFAEGSRVRVTMSSAPVSGRSYTLVTASGGITGTPVLESLTVNGVAREGYQLGVNGNNLELQQVTRTTPTITVTPAVGGYIYSASYQGPGVSEVNKGGSTGGVTLSYAGTGSTTYAASSTPPTSAGTYTVTATVAADSTYTQASSVPTAFTIVKATPTVSVAPTASAVTVGAVLSTSTLSGGTATVAGTFAWTTPSTVVSATSSYPVTFTPTDGANYNTASSAASVTANPAGTTYSSWLNGNGASDAAFLDYVFGAVTAGTLDASLKPAVAVTGGNLVLTYNVRQGTVGLTVTAQTSADLATGAAGWGTSGVTDIAVGSPRTVNGVSVQQRTASVSASGGKMFLRVKAEQAP